MGGEREGEGLEKMGRKNGEWKRGEEMKRGDEMGEREGERGRGEVERGQERKIRPCKTEMKTKSLSLSSSISPRFLSSGCCAHFLWLWPLLDFFELVTISFFGGRWLDVKRVSHLPSFVPSLLSISHTLSTLPFYIRSLIIVIQDQLEFSPPKTLNLIAASKILFPNKVIFTNSRDSKWLSEGTIIQSIMTILIGTYSSPAPMYHKPHSAFSSCKEHTVLLHSLIDFLFLVEGSSHTVLGLLLRARAWEYGCLGSVILETPEKLWQCLEKLCHTQDQTNLLSLWSPFYVLVIFHCFLIPHYMNRNTMKTEAWSLLPAQNKHKVGP